MRQAAQGPDEALLSHVLGVLPMTEHAVTQTEDLALKPFDKLDHGDLLARQTTVNYLVKAVAQKQLLCQPPANSPSNTAAETGQFQVVQIILWVEDRQPQGTG